MRTTRAIAVHQRPLAARRTFFEKIRGTQAHRKDTYRQTAIEIRWLYIGPQFRPNPSGLTRAFNGGDLGVELDWLFVNGSLFGEFKKRVSYWDFLCAQTKPDLFQ
jgi:hypothetical protein